MERSVSARSDRNILDHLWRWTSLTGRSGPTETCHSIYKNSRSPWCDRNFGQNVNETLRSGWKLTFYEKRSSSFPWLVLLPVGQAQWKAPLRFNFPDHADCVPQIAVDAWDRCFHESATWRKPIGDRVADRSQTVAGHMETRFKLNWKHLEALHY